jgi:hypothetical protein
MKRKCPICQVTFEKQRMGQKVCSPTCSIEYVKQQADKADRKLTKEKLERLKPVRTLKSEAQAAINAFRRESDLKAGYGCICCGKPFEAQRPGGSIDAGHYLSRGSHPHLAFVEMNINAQRKNCNKPGGTTAAAAKALGRKWVGFEIDETNGKIIAERLSK